jgi:hypothetical protein
VTPLPTALPTPGPTSQPTTKDDDDDSGVGTSKEYTTPDADKATDNAKGVMFYITAKSKDVSITALGIVGKDAKNSDIRIYAQAGSYEDFPDNRSGKRIIREPRLNMGVWDGHFKGKVMLNPKDIVYVELDEEITIPAGDTVSLYVVSKKGVLCKESSSHEFEPYAESDDFVLKVGTTTTKKQFKQREILANFAGRIVYQTSP